MSNKYIRDGILLLSILVLAGVLYLCFSPADSLKGSTVSVEIGGKSYGRYSLSVDKEIDLDGKGRLIIENGRAYMRDPTCPGHDCERMRGISDSGESIVCLPNAIFITVEGEIDFSL